jgi:hypothetical protein
MKATNEDPPCCNQAVKPKRRRPQRGGQYWYLSNSVFDLCSTQWDDDGTDEGEMATGQCLWKSGTSRARSRHDQRDIAHFARKMRF